jgi:hypothetical protein
MQERAAMSYYSCLISAFIILPLLVYWRWGIWPTAALILIESGLHFWIVSTHSLPYLIYGISREFPERPLGCSFFENLEYIVDETSLLFSIPVGALLAGIWAIILLYFSKTNRRTALLPLFAFIVVLAGFFASYPLTERVREDLSGYTRPCAPNKPAIPPPEKPQGMLPSQQKWMT